MTKFKHLARFIGVFLAVCMVSPYAYASGHNVSGITEIILTTLEVDETGLTTAIGYIPTAEDGTQVTCLAMDTETFSTAEHIMWVDQMTVGNNGTFMTRFYVPSKFSNSKMYIRFGSNTEAETITETLKIGELPTGIGNIVNGSVIYGNDAYMADSVYFNAQYVSDSIAAGGNKIYFKVGNRIYDLMDSAATSNAYLVADNAMTADEVSEIKLRYYYTTAKRVNCEV